MRIETAKAIFIVKQDHLKLIIKEGAEIGVKDAQDIVCAFLELKDHHHLPLISDARKLRSVEPQAKRIFANEFIGVRIAANAVIVDSVATRIIANAFMQLYKPVFPMKLFPTEEKALEWVKRFTGKKQAE